MMGSDEAAILVQLGLVLKAKTFPIPWEGLVVSDPLRDLGGRGFGEGGAGEVASVVGSD